MGRMSTQQSQSLQHPTNVKPRKYCRRSPNQFVTNPEFQTLPEDLQSSLSSFEAMTEELRNTLQTSGPKIDELLASANDTVKTVNEELPQLSALAKQNLALLDEAIMAFESAMTEIDGLVSEDSATTYELNKALRELAQAGRALQLLAKTLEEQPEALIRGKREETP